MELRDSGRFQPKTTYVNHRLSHMITFCTVKSVTSQNETALFNLLSTVHKFNRCFDSLQFIHGPFRVNVLPVLTVWDCVAAALPVWSDPGEKHIDDISPH